MRKWLGFDATSSETTAGESRSPPLGSSVNGTPPRLTMPDYKAVGGALSAVNQLDPSVAHSPTAHPMAQYQYQNQNQNQQNLFHLIQTAPNPVQMGLTPPRTAHRQLSLPKQLDNPHPATSPRDRDRDRSRARPVRSNSDHHPSSNHLSNQGLLPLSFHPHGTDSSRDQLQQPMPPSPRSVTPTSFHSSGPSPSSRSTSRTTAYTSQNTFTLARPAQNAMAAASLYPNSSASPPIHSSPTVVHSTASSPTTKPNTFKISPLPTPPSIKDNLPPPHMDPRDFVALSIYYHEETPFMDLATYYASLSAASGNSVGLFLYGIALRHGLGVEKDTAKGLEILSRSADAAMGSYAGGTLPGLNAGSLAGAKSFASVGSFYAPAMAGGGAGGVGIGGASFTDTLARLPGTGAVRMLAKKELAMVLFEIGNSYRNGWGVSKSESTAMYYYLVASGLGEVDAHVALGDIHMRGEMGCRKDKKAAAKFYRLAVEGGYKEPSLHWIYKEKWL